MSGSITEYYLQHRCMLKSEVMDGPDGVVVRSFDIHGHEILEFYKYDGTRVGRLDPKRSWVVIYLQTTKVRDKDVFLAEQMGPIPHERGL